MSNMIYQKTLQGTDEINHRSDIISSRLRRLLIMIDGRKTVDDLVKMAPIENVDEALRQLVEMHLIEPHKTTMADLITNSRF